jgi:hypothetical protein
VKQIRKRLTYANVMSSLAMFLVLGGATAFAAHQLAKKSVGTKQLKSNAVTTAKIKKEAVSNAKIKKEAVTGDKIQNNAVSGEKIKAGAVDASKIAAGAVGAAQLGANAAGNAQTQFVKVFRGEAVSAAIDEASAPRIELGSVGPFRFYGKCFFEGVKVREKTYIELTGSGQATLGSEDGATLPRAGKQEYLTSATPEKERAIEEEAEAGVNEASARSNDEEFQAFATDGTQVTGLIGGTGAKQGNPPPGNGPFLSGDSCIVGTVAIFGS